MAMSYLSLFLRVHWISGSAVLLLVWGLAVSPSVRAESKHPEGEALENLPLPAPRFQTVPHLQIRPHPAARSPYKGPVYRAHLDGTGRPRFMEQAEAFLVLDDHGRVVKRLPARGKLRDCQPARRTCSTVKAAADGSWLAEIAPKTQAGERYSWVWGQTGKLLRKLPGWLQAGAAPLDRWAYSHRGQLHLTDERAAPRSLLRADVPFGGYHACLFPEGNVVLSGLGHTVIHHFDSLGKETVRRRLKANCSQVACLPRQGRMLIHCYEQQIAGGLVVPTQEQLILLNGEGRRVSALPLGTQQAFLDEVAQSALLWDNSGEVAQVELETGALLRHLSLPKPDQPGSWVLHRALPFRYAVAGLWKQKASGAHSWPGYSDQARLVIYDLSGKPREQRDLKLANGHVDPPIWRLGQSLYLLTGDEKLRIDLGRDRGRSIKRPKP